MSPELSKKLEELYHFGAENSSIDLHSSLHLATDKIIEKLSDPDASQLKKNTERLMIIIEMIYKECNYQKLCFQVADIHRIIAEKTQYRWRLDGFKRVWHRFICPNVSAFLATFLIAIMVFIGKDFNMKSFLPNVIICIIPSLLSIVFNCKKNRT